MENKPAGKWKAPFGNSITRRYATGYILITAIAVVLFLVSFFSGRMLSSRYELAVNDLLELNNLFVRVEDTNRVVFDYYFYLRPLSGQQYYQDAAKTREQLEDIQAHMDASYSREVMDLCCIVDTFLQKTDQLVANVTVFRSEGGTGNRTALAAAYSETQQILGFISQSFQDVYISKLETTSRMQTQLMQIQRILYIVQISMLILAVAVSAVFFHRVVRGMSDSVNQLIDLADGITRNPRCQEHIHLDTGDELTVFADAFNEMMDTIHAQMEQIEQNSRMREQLQKVEMENLRISSALQSSQLKLLQARINPHFLFNTLNMATQMAHMEDAEETAQLLEATADFLRYNLGKVTKSVTLLDEIENTKNYVYIQRCRFGDRIRFAFDVDETCGRLEIPCMILQPLVENAVSHGVGSMIGGGAVTVRLFRQGNGVCLEVRDNGVGMEPQVLEKLRKSFTQELFDDGHIGLHNVYQRLRLFFGAELGFEVESHPGDTCIRMLLPE